MSAKKKGVPGWFPFAMASTVVIGLMSGARSRWKLLYDDAPKPPAPPEPGVKGAPYWP